MFEEVPIRVQLPPSIEAKEIGIRNLEGLCPSRAHTVRTAGMNTTTTGVLLMKADMKQTAVSEKTMNRRGFPRERSANFPPSTDTSPLRISAALRTNMAAIVMSASLPKPSNSSFGLRSPRSPIATSISNPTRSVRIRSLTNKTTVKASMTYTVTICQSILAAQAMHGPRKLVKLEWSGKHPPTSESLENRHSTRLAVPGYCGRSQKPLAFPP